MKMKRRLEAKVCFSTLKPPPPRLTIIYDNIGVHAESLTNKMRKSSTYHFFPSIFFDTAIKFEGGEKNKVEEGRGELRESYTFWKIQKFYSGKENKPNNECI